MENSLTQSQNPSGTSAKQYVSNQRLVVGKDTSKDFKRNLKDKIYSIQKWLEELDREIDIVMDQMGKKDEKIQLLEIHNRKLAKINEQPSMGTKKMSSKISPHQDYKAVKPSIVKLKNGDISDETEKVIVCHLRDSEEKLNERLWRNSKTHKNRHVAISKSEIKDMPEDEREEDRTFPALLEVGKREEDSFMKYKPKMHKKKRVVISTSEIKDTPVDEHEEDPTFPALLEAGKQEKDSVVKSKPLKYLCYLWDLVKSFLAVMLSFGFGTCLILSYAYYVNHNCIANSITLLFSDHDIAELTQLLSPYLTWRNNGLLPF